MTNQTLCAIGELVDGSRPPGSFAARRTAPASSVGLEVSGVGPIELPVSADRARQLREIARPAHYGLREQTLLDTRVRDTWQVPRELVTLERWDATLTPILEALRGDLGLPEDRVLTADLHSMLVYEEGQFFRPHQDSEKADGMIGTLVVTLPSEFTGGDLVIEHRGQRVVERGSSQEIVFFAFYADCAHEVLPVTEGFRVTLTFNLVVGGRAAKPDPIAELMREMRGEALAHHLREHFTIPVRRHDWHLGAGPTEQPPRLYVHLLEHQYSQHGLVFDGLKGADATTVATLREAADAAGCATALALADVKETHVCDYFEDEYWMCGRSRRWEVVDGVWALVDESWEAVDDEDEPFDDEEGGDRLPADHPENFGPDAPGQDLGARVSLTWWRDGTDGQGIPVDLYVTDDEVTVGTTAARYRPFVLESEGYMGNDGNTVDRWYRRAAVVVRPRDRPVEFTDESSSDAAEERG